jgi:hypothetical protein
VEQSYGVVILALGTGALVNRQGQGSHLPYRPA